MSRTHSPPRQKMNNIYLIENHDEALRIWRQKGIEDIDLVHIDAHIDYEPPAAKPVEKILDEAKNLKELKKGLEYSLAYMKYIHDFDKQTNIKNYIYPAREEGIVKKFYWVIPGRENELKRFRKSITDITICTLEMLPVLKQPILLDIDVDFLVMDSLRNANNTRNIGIRKPWIFPQELVSILKKKIENPQIITIAYSVNGGFTPIKYKHLGDEIAYYFSPSRFKKHLKNSSQASEYFNQFLLTGKKEQYWNAVKLNPTYRVQDNNYGPLYFHSRKFSLAEREFSKTLQVDPQNPACLLGLGNIALERKAYKKAKELFLSSLNTKENSLFRVEKKQSLLGLARAEFYLNNHNKAKNLFFKYQKLEPLDSRSYYFLGCIFEKEKDFERAAEFFKDAARLKTDDANAILRLLRIFKHIADKENTAKYIISRYKHFKIDFAIKKGQSLKLNEKLGNLRQTEKKMDSIEKRLPLIRAHLKHNELRRI